MNLDEGLLNKRYRVCGGSARFVFDWDYSIPIPKKFVHALNDVNAARGISRQTFRANTFRTDDDNFPAINSLSSQGMFQFTIAAENPIRGGQIMEKLCKLYKEPKLYFVVPPHRYLYFRKQSSKAKNGTNNVHGLSGLNNLL